MMKRNNLIKYLSFGLFSFLVSNHSMALPDGFVYLKDIDPSIIQDIRYFTSNNFVGEPIKGYQAPQCILTKNAALALSQLQQTLKQQSLAIKVYDCYRPQMAVDHFIAWSHDPNAQKMKKEYYPNVNKTDVFQLGYVAEKSSHTRGSTVDMTLVKLLPGNKVTEVEMGTHFDYLDELSHPFSEAVPNIARANRLQLRTMMQQAGFKPIETEWWHFTLANEPYPDTYFNFPVK